MRRHKRQFHTRHTCHFTHVAHVAERGITIRDPLMPSLCLTLHPCSVFGLILAALLLEVDRLEQVVPGGAARGAVCPVAGGVRHHALGGVSGEVGVPARSVGARPPGSVQAGVTVQTAALGHETPAGGGGGRVRTQRSARDRRGWGRGVDHEGGVWPMDSALSVGDAAGYVLEST